MTRTPVFNSPVIALLIAFFATTAVNAQAPQKARQAEQTQASDSANPSDSQAKAAEDSNGTNRKSVAEIVEDARDAIMIVRQLTSDATSRAIGCGFVIDAKAGLIATNHHVIGEARPIQVETKDGRKLRVLEVHASDRRMDLAILKVDGRFDKQIPIATNELQQGASVVAIGHPGGLEHTVVEGLLSARKMIDERPMLQLSIPIEQGNSGGPVLDRMGNVHGVLTLKSLKANNTGFAVDISVLKQLLKNPNPIAIDQWLTIGQLDEKNWEPLFQAMWKQRVDRLFVEGAGRGFGGRSLCLRRDQLTEAPIELSVDVKMDNESGAAGLAFYADGKNKHYGFYPSNGRIRLTRFDGPDVYSWNVLQEVDSPAYQPGEFNSLRVSISKDSMKCYINDTLVITSTDKRYQSGRPGLAKFRQTRAEFRNFRMTTPVSATKTTVARFNEWVPRQDVEFKPTDIDQLASDPGATAEFLLEKSRQLDRQAQSLRKLANRVSSRRVQLQLVKEMSRPEKEINLLKATLLLSKLDNPDIDVELYEREVVRMAEQIRKRIDDTSDDAERIKILNQYLFRENGFHGNAFEYYTRSNSYMNEVIYNRQGLPITLSVLYLELGNRIGLNVVGVGLPGHFVVRVEPKTKPGKSITGNKENNKDANKQLPAGILIDPFERGATLSNDEAKTLVRTSGLTIEDGFNSQTQSQILRRMFRNLINLGEQARDTPRLLRYMETLVQLFPNDVEFRAKRVDLRTRDGNIDGALADIDWFLKQKPEGIDIDALREFRTMLEKRKR